jgi:hypothetical protein
MGTILFKIGLAFLKAAFADVGATAVQLAKEAEAHADWTGAEKFGYVFNGLVAKYRRLENYRWLLRFITEYAAGIAGSNAKVLP